MAAGDKKYLTTDGDELDLIAHLEYGISSDATEMLYDRNYRIAEHDYTMEAGVEVVLPKYTPPKLNQLIRLWD